MSISKRSALVKSVGLASAFGWLPAAAQTTIPADNSNYEITPHFWASALRADVNTRQFGTQTLDVPFSDIATALNFAAMGAIEARKGPWGGLIDVQDVKLSASSSPVIAPFANLDITYEQQISTLAGFYRLADGPASVDVVGGARYVYIQTEASVTTVLAPIGPSPSTSKGQWEGMVGVRAQCPIDAKWSLLGYLDVGGGSTRSWQLMVGANYRYSNETTVKLGYRYFSFDRGDAPVGKASLGGP